MIERLPTPFGLVRSGVAPDHPKLKEAILVYDRIARMPGFSFFGNVSVGRDVSVAELRAAYHAVVFACGAANRPPIGHPSARTCRAVTRRLSSSDGLTVTRITAIGHLTSVRKRWRSSDRATWLRTFAVFSRSQWTSSHHGHCRPCPRCSRRKQGKEIHIIGRRGPVQAKFTTKELRELGELAGCATLVDPAELTLNAASQAELADRSN